LSSSVAYAENSRWGAKFRYNRVMSQINFRTTILGVSGVMSPGKFSKITPKNTQITPKNTHLHLKIRILFIIFSFLGSEGGHGTVPPSVRQWSSLYTVVCLKRSQARHLPRSPLCNCNVQSSLPYFQMGQTFNCNAWYKWATLLSKGPPTPVVI